MVVYQFTGGQVDTLEMAAFKPAAVQMLSIYQRQEVFVEARVVGQFRVKRGSEKMPLLGGDNPPVGNRSEDFCIAAHRLNNRRADENRMIWRVRCGGAFEFGDVEVYLERIHLAAEGIALHLDIHEAQQGLIAPNIFRQEDGACTRPPNGMALTKLPQRFHQAISHGKFADGGGFAAGDNETVQSVQVLGQTDFGCLYFQAFEHGDMLGKIAL